MIKQFKDIKSGQRFKALTGDRTFIKLQDTLPSGIKVEYNGFCREDHEWAKKGQRTNSKPFNAVDSDGIPGSCPDWLEFEVIDE